MFLPAPPTRQERQHAEALSREQQARHKAGLAAGERWALNLATAEDVRNVGGEIEWARENAGPYLDGFFEGGAGGAGGDGGRAAAGDAV